MSQLNLPKCRLSTGQLASPQTSFRVRSPRVHFSPTAGGEMKRDERASKDVRGEATGQRSFAFRGAKEYNLLPKNIWNLNNVSNYKRKVAAHFLGNSS